MNIFIKKKKNLTLWYGIYDMMLVVQSPRMQLSGELLDVLFFSAYPIIIHLAVLFADFDTSYDILLYHHQGCSFQVICWMSCLFHYDKPSSSVIWRFWYFLHHILLIHHHGCGSHGCVGCCVFYPCLTSTITKLFCVPFGNVTWKFWYFLWSLVVPSPWMQFQVIC